MWRALVASSRITLQTHGSKKWHYVQIHTISYSIGFMWTEQYKNLPIPVVDLHGYQMINHGLGVLWKTSNIDAENKKETFSCKAANFSSNAYQFQHLCNNLEVETASVFYFLCYVHFYSELYPLASIFLHFHSLLLWWLSISAKFLMPHDNSCKGSFFSLLVLMYIFYLFTFHLSNFVAEDHKFNWNTYFFTS